MSQQTNRDNLLDNVEAAASQCERELHGCGRCVLSALLSNFDLADKSSAELALKGILPLSGGIAQTRNTCAALLGGLMGIGMVSFPGRLEDSGIDDIRAAMKLGNEYYRKFEKEIGNTRCFDIRAVGLGRCFDTADPDEYQKFVEAGAYELCGNVCGKAARMAAEFMLDIQEGRRKS